MSNILEYKGYHTKVEYDVESSVLHGKVEFISDLITFESESVTEIEKEFHDAVDDYLELCEEIGKEPAKEFRGSFNVRISPELHKKAAIAALKKGISLNQFISEAIEKTFDETNNDIDAVTIWVQEYIKKITKEPIDTIDKYSKKTLGENVIAFERKGYMYGN